MSTGPDVESTGTPDANSAMKASLRAAAVPVRANPVAALGASAALIALIVLSVAWEWWLAPLRPGGSALVLKAVPLVLALPGVWRRRLYTLQWASMLILLYFAEGVVRGWSDRGLSARLGWLQAALAVVFFVCTLAYVGPFKRAAKWATKRKASDTALPNTSQATSQADGQSASQASGHPAEEDAQQAGAHTTARAASHATSAETTLAASRPTADNGNGNAPGASPARPSDAAR
ncbi:putative membrane protein [Paraburkholderia sp. GAS333]